MEENALITGCNGFVGRHLSSHLHYSGVKVLGIGIEDEPWAPWVDYRRVDIANFQGLLSAIGGWIFDRIFHLAAIANPRIAFEDPLLAVQANVMGSINLLEVARRNPVVHVLVVGSSEVYRARTGRRVRFTEHDPIEPRNIYGATKTAVETIGREYARNYDLQICFTRSFNHAGPGQLPLYVLSDFAKQCAEIRAKKKEPFVHVGNVHVSRDFTDVRDVVRAYALIAEKGRAGEAYNVCSGNPYRIDWLLAFLVSLTGRKDVKIVEQPDRIRKNDPPMVYGSNKKLASDTGWRPEIPIEKTLSDLFEYWVARV
ncbi:MAG: GDP-mannose 4,6-dehydratase [Planctomycetes bacterium]|nr:GDP-mannose 4,6-dehydratase [Planctomycetota bacterium]